MASQFNMDMRSQREWSWLLAIDLFLGGVGGGLFLLYRALFLASWIGLLALCLVLAGGGVLLLELGHPLRAWRAIFRPQISWISRGVLCIALFVLTALVSLAPSFPELSWVPGRGNLQFLEANGLIASLCALFITLYPAFVLGSSPSIPFWDTPLLPPVFFAQGLLGASGILLLASGSSSTLAAVIPKIHSIATILIAGNLVAVLAYLAIISRSGLAEKESVRLLRHGGLRWTFRGAILIGMVLPLLLIAVSQSAFLAGACILAGGPLFRLCILKAGVYVPSALVGLDMSGFKGDRSDFALEYTDWAVTSAGNSAQK